MMRTEATAVCAVSELESERGASEAMIWNWKTKINLLSAKFLKIHLEMEWVDLWQLL